MQPIKLNRRWILPAILIASAGARALAALALGDHVVNLPGTFDQISYHSLALRVLGGHGFSFGQLWWPITAANAPTAHWSFLYTLYLVVVYALFGPHPVVARLIQAVAVGVLQPLLTYAIARRLFGRTVGLVAAALNAVYIYFIYYSGTLMTEPFYITAILAAVYVTMLLVGRLKGLPEGMAKGVRSLFPERSITGLALALGLLLGAAVLMRQVFLLFAPFLFLWILWVAGRRRLVPALGALAVSGALIVGMILPFTAYNYSRFGHFVLLNTNAGYAFFYANHPIYGTHFVSILTPEMGTYQDLIPVELRSLDEAALDQALLKRGMGFVFEDPVRYALLSLSRIESFFMFWPSPKSEMISNLSRVGSFGILWPFMLYGAGVAVFSKRYRVKWNSPAVLMLGFTVIYTAIHLLSWALIRYRLPVDAVMLVFAGLGLTDLAHRMAAWRSRSVPGSKHASQPEAPAAIAANSGTGNPTR